ncbi:MAG: hypothetical protein ACOC56_07120 [Atribacterota bacterium]
MDKYYVNKNAQLNGDHEVHKENCSYLPDKKNLICLGSFDNCYDAVREARNHYNQVNGCYWCANACHTG